jgi:hypothetical protein
MRTPVAFRIAALGAGLAAAPAAHALEMEFYTYNAFEETVAGFQRVALVLQDPAFLVFALVFAVLGTLVSLLTAAAKGVMGQQINPVSVLIPAIIGIAIFRGLIIPTGTIHIYDPVRNAYQPVGDVPDAVILVAGVLNKIERGVVEIVETASADPAAERSGSLRYSLVLNALTSKRQDTYFERNSSIYFTECGFPSMGMGYNGSSLDNLLRRSTDLIEEWQRWAHPSIFATIYSGTGDQKVTMSCKDVWNNVLKPTATDPAQFAEMVESVCRKVGFDPAVATQAARCEEELTSLQTLYGVTATASLPFVRSIVFAGSVTDALRDADISVQQGALVNRQVMAEGFGAAEAMDRWVPKLRGFMTATVLGLVPLVCLFMLTPVMGKAMSLVIGLFLWLALWGVSDAISVQMAADAAADAFDEIRRFGLSYDSLMLSPEAAIQSLGVFGKARTMALMLATVLSYGLFSFGGYAFTSMAQAWQSDLQQAGESAGRTVLSPEERGALMSRLVATPSGEAAIATGGFTNAAYASAAGSLRSLGGVMSDRQYVSGSLQGNALPGGAGGTDTTPTDTSPSPGVPGGGASATTTPEAGAPSRAGYVSDRWSGATVTNPAVKPGGSGGTDTTPIEFGRAVNPSTRALPAPSDGESTLPDVTVAAGGYRADSYDARHRSVADLNVAEGALDAAERQGRLAGMEQLAENRGTSLDVATRDVSGTRTSRDANRTESYRARMDEDRTSVSQGGAFEGAADAGRFFAERTVFDNVNGTEELSADSARQFGAFNNAAAIGQSAVVNPERLAQNYSTQTVIQTESNRAIEARDAATTIGETQGAGQAVDAAAFERTREAFGNSSQGESALTAGRAASMTSNASYGVTLSRMPGGTEGNARSLGELNAASDLGRRAVVETVREKIGEEPTVDGRVRTQEALQGNQSLALSAPQAQRLIANTPELELTPQQLAVAGERPLRANVGVSDGELVTADMGAGVSVSRSSVAQDDHSYRVAGGLMALDDLDQHLLAITDGNPIHGEMDFAAKMTVAHTIASAIEGTGASVSASRTESQATSGGVSLSGGAKAGVVRKNGSFGSAGVGAQGQFTGQVSDDSSTKLDGTVAEGVRILEDSRKATIGDLERRLGASWEMSMSPEDFARQWNERIKRMALESADRLHDDGKAALDSHDPVEAGAYQRNQEIAPRDRHYSDKELAYMGGVKP